MPLREDKTNKTNKTMASPDPLPLNLMKSLRRMKEGSDSGSSNGGNDSGDSALISLGNSSFGFNFDSEEGINSSRRLGSGPNSEPNSEQNSEDDGNGPMSPRSVKSSSSEGSRPAAAPQHESHSLKQSSTSSLTNSTNSNNENSSAENAAAAAGLQVTLQSIARSAAESCDRKRKCPSRSVDNDSGGYDTDDEGNAPKHSDETGVKPVMARSNHGCAGSTGDEPKGKKKRGNGDGKREERNAREKERSLRISTQINEIRDILSTGGVVVPKGTKSSVLTEAANYIRTLQQHQYRSEM
jgi:hypothetical protein